MNERINLINEVVKKYNLTPDETNQLVNYAQNTQEPLSLLKTNLENMCNYFQHQNYLSNKITNTPPLPPGKNYYVTAFDSQSQIYLQPVSVVITNPDTSEVLVENTFKGYQKHTQVDDIEIAICQIGRLLDFDIVEEYRLYNQNKQKDSIIIRDIINENEFYDVENLQKRFTKLINNGKLKKEKWVDTTTKLSVANSKEDYQTTINYGLNILKSLPSILEEDYQKIKTAYLNMLLFDSLINQSERNFQDYGILCDKVTKRYTFAPLFDNVFPSILKNNDIISLNGITCNRYELMECLFYNYYQFLEPKITQILQNKNKYLQNIDIILKYNLDINNYNLMMKNLLTNINYLEKLNNERNLMMENQNNAGYVSTAQLLMGLGIIIIFSICIAYLLYCIK